MRINGCYQRPKFRKVLKKIFQAFPPKKFTRNIMSDKAECLADVWRGGGWFAPTFVLRVLLRAVSCFVCGRRVPLKA